MTKKNSKSKESLVPGAGLKFEAALARLEKITQEMESGDLPLEEALAHYEEGIGLARFCTQKLNEITKKVELLKKNAQGQWVREPFDTKGFCAAGDKED